MMKIWNAFASEHSAALVMIGRFKTVHAAEEANRLIDQLREHVLAEHNDHDIVSQPNDTRFSDQALQLLKESQLYSLYPSELGQFELDVRNEVQGDRITLSTDEVDVSAFLKLLIDRGARVEVYSAHEYSDTDNAE